MKIGDIVAVSTASKSKVSGKKCIVIGFNFSRGQVKVQSIRSNGFISPFVGYVKERHVAVIPQVVPVVEEVESHDGYV